MLDCKEITTHMESNLKLLSDASSESNEDTMYRQMIGSWMYLKNTRADICFAVNTLSQFPMELIHVQLIVVKNVLRYLKGIVDYGIRYDATYIHGRV